MLPPGFNDCEDPWHERTNGGQTNCKRLTMNLFLGEWCNDVGLLEIP